MPTNIPTNFIYQTSKSCHTAGPSLRAGVQQRPGGLGIGLTPHQPSDPAANTSLFCDCSLTLWFSAGAGLAPWDHLAKFGNMWFHNWEIGCC